MKRTYEIQVCIPSGCRLVGCKTDGDIAVVIFEDAEFNLQMQQNSD